MNEIIKINENGRPTAKELYEFLNPTDLSHYSRWVKSNITNNEFYSSDVDWWAFAIMANGNKTTDYELTLDFAKHLCMLSRTERGKQARNYFIEVEKRYIQSQTKQLSIEDLVILQAQSVKELKSKVEGIEDRVSSLESSVVKVDPKQQRSEINSLIRSYAACNNLSVKSVWVELQSQFLNHYSINLSVRCRNRDISVLEYAQNKGLLSDLLELATKIFGGND